MSYTSNSEFDANRRVQITNEIPPYDYFDGIHSTLTDDMWKWLLGYSRITFDLPDEETLKETGAYYDTDDYFHKIVNGQLSTSYGPKPKKVWNPTRNDYDVVRPEYHGMDVYGILLPEEDLFLHEIYRYLECLYPDHPDWTILLTNNEINDLFTNAAHMVNYNPDNLFFEKVAESLDSKLSDVDIIEEAFKIKYRNLTNNAFRRKLYGSRFGYNMFVHDIFQTCSIFPMGTYIPIKPVYKQFLDPKDPTGNTIITYDELNTSLYDIKNIDTRIPTKSLNNRFIDTYDAHYYNKFRLIDWTGESNGYSSIEDESVKIIAYTIPDDATILYEFPASSAPLTHTSFVLNDLVLADDSTNYLTINDIKYNIAHRIYRNNGKTWNQVIDGTNLVGAIQVSFTIDPTYIPLLKASNRDLTDTDDARVVDPSDLLTQPGTNYSFINYVLNIEDRLSPTDVIFDPYIQGRIHIRPSQILSYYRDNIAFDYSLWPINDDVEEPYILGLQSESDEDAHNWPPFNIDSEDPKKRESVPLNYNDVLTNCKSFTNTDPLLGTKSLISKDLYMLMVSGFNSKSGNRNDCGKLTIQHIPDINYNFDEPTNLTKRPVFGIRITNCNDQQIVLLGQIKNLVCNKIPGYRIQPVSCDFFVKAIPEYKTDEMLKLCYGEKESYTDEERANKSLLFNDEDTAFTLYESFTNSRTAGLDVKGFIRLAQDEKHKKVIYESYPDLGYGKLTSFDFGCISTVPVYEDSLLYTASNSLKTCNISKDGTILNLVSDLDKSDVSLPLDNESIVYLLKHSNILTNYNKIIKTYDEVIIRSEINVEDSSMRDLITFTDDTSKELFKTLSIGDKIYGPSITSTNLYITELLTNQVRVSEPLTKSGVFNLTYLCKMNYTSTDTSTEFAAFRKKLFKNGNLRLNDPFKQTLWPNKGWPNSSLSFIDGYTDTSLYTPFVGWSKGSPAVSYLTDYVIPAIHGDKAVGTKTDSMGKVVYANQLIPCSIKMMGDLFIDLNLNRTYNIPNRQGIYPTLNNVEWLDYMCNNANELTRASDNVNFGTQLLMETDTSGLYSLLQGASYTDPSTRVKFQTFNWKSDTVPVYAQIGIGGSNYSKYWKDLNDVTYPSLYGNAIYDTYINKVTYDELGEPIHHEIADIAEDYKNNGGNVKTRHIYTDTENRKLFSEDDVISLDTIDNPIAEIPLGEYDVQMHYRPNTGTQTLDVMTVQVNIYKQEFSNINKKLEDEIKIMSYKLEDPNSNIFINPENANCFGNEYASDDYHPLSFKCLGEWVPSVTYSLDGTCSIDWPSISYEDQVEGQIVTRTYSLIDRALMDRDEGKDCLISSYEKGIIPYFIVNTGNLYHNVKLTKENDIAGRYTDGETKGLNIYEELDVDKKYTVQIENKSILTLEPIFEIKEVETEEGLKHKLFICKDEDGNVKYRWTNKVFKFSGGFSLPEGISTIYTDTITNENYIKAILKKGLASVVRYSRENYSIDQVARQWTGTAYYCPEFNGITYNGANATLHWSNNTITARDYMFAFNRFYNKDLVINANDDPYYTRATNDLLPYYMDFTNKVFFVHALKDSTYYEEGDVFCIYPTYQEDQLRFSAVKMDKTLHFVSTLPITQDTILADEFSLFLKNDCYWQRAITNYTNKIQLPRSFIADGSYKINLVINPNFEGSVYNYDEYINYLNGTNIVDDKNVEPEPHTKVITDSTIKYDDEYDVFYITEQILDDAYYTQKQPITETSNTVSVKKYVIKFNENKFFKNAKYITGKYQLVKTQNPGSTEIIATPTLSGTDINGLQFNISDMTVADKVLSASLVQLRSNEVSSLRPQFFNNYKKVSGQLAEIGNDYIKLSYDTITRKPIDNRDTSDPLFKYAVSLNMINSLSDLLPVSNTYDTNGDIDVQTVYDESAVVKFTNGSLNFDNKVYQAPAVTDIQMSKVKEYSGVNVEFKYYKNLLLFEGQVFPNNPNTIYAGTNTYTTSAFSQVQAGDTLVEVVALSSKNKQTVNLKLVKEDNTPLYPDFAIFADGYLLAAKGTELYMAEGNSLASFSNTVQLAQLKFADSEIAGNTSMYKPFDDADVGAKVTNMGIQTSATGKNFIIELSSTSTPNDPKTELIKIPLNTLTSEMGVSSSLYTSNEVDDNGNLKYVDDTSNNVVTLFDWKSDVLKVDSLAMSVLGRDIIHSTTPVSVTDANSQEYNMVTEGTSLWTGAKSSYYTADSKEGYEAVISGDYLFVKSPTALVDSNGNYDGTTSEFMHWKAAKLPKTVDHTRVKLNALSTEDYLSTVSGLLTMYYTLTPKDKYDTGNNAYNGITWAQLAAATLDSSESGNYYKVGNLTITENIYKEATVINAIRNLIKSIFIDSTGAFTGSGSSESAITIKNSSDFESAYATIVAAGTGESANATFSIPGWSITNGIAELGTNKRYNVKITNNPLARENRDTNVALFEEAYSNTINDFLIYVLGLNEKESLITDAVSVNFADGKLVVKTVNEDLVSIRTSKLTKRDDIEDPDNWVASIYPAKVTFSTSSLKNSGETFNIKFNGIDYQLPTTPAEMLNKVFKITCHYKVGLKEIYGGYYIDKATLAAKYNATDAYQEQSFDDFCRDANVEMSQHPFLMFSTDGTAFSIVDLPASNVCHLNGKGKDNSPYHGRLVGFIEKDDAVYGVLARSVNKASGVNNFVLSPYALKITIDNDGEMDLTLGTNDTSLAYVTREEAKVTKELAAAVTRVSEPSRNNYDDDYEKELSKEYGATTIELPADTLDQNLSGQSTGTETLAFTPGSDTLAYVSYSALSLKAQNPTVARCGMQSISFSDDLVDMDPDSTDAITVFVALQTTADIIDQTQYINPAKYDQYAITGQEKFKVSDVIEVNSYLGANRMYNKKEITTPIYDSNGNVMPDETGYPSTMDDTDHIYYEWIESNKLEYTPVTKVGDFYYTNEDDPTTLVVLNEEEEGESFTVYNGNLCWKHYQTVYTPEIFVNGAGSEISLCDRDGKYFVQAGDDVPRAVQFASLPKLVANNISAGYAYSAPKPSYDKVKDAQNDPDLRIIDENISQTLKRVITKLDEFSIAENAPYIKFNIDPVVATDLKAFVKVEERLNDANYCTENEDTGVMTISDTFNRFIDFRAIIPYTATNSPAKLNNNYFDFEDGTNVLRDSSQTAINGVYIPLKGYGGTFDNNSPWTTHTPWELDPAAFEYTTTTVDGKLIKEFKPMVNSFNEPIYLCDKHGTLLQKNGKNIPFMTPKYHSLAELVQYEDYEILDTIPEYTAKNAGNDGKYIVNSLYNIKSISSKAITFTEPLTFNENDTDIDINDGDEHILCLKLLTVNPIEIDFLHMNNPDYIVEIPLSATSTYGYDRVFWDDKGYPKSPIMINNVIYRSENNDKYNTTDYTCENGAIVYECNEEGKYITYSGNGTELTARVLGDERGNVAEDQFFQQYGDQRVRPKTPRYTSCQDWFKSDYYIKGQEKNPFWQIIQFTSKYDVKTMRYNQIVDLYSYVKSANTMYLDSLDKSDQYVLVTKAPSIISTDNTIDIIAYDNYIDCKKGTIKFILTQNHESSYYDSKNPIFVKYGIVVANPKYDDSSISILAVDTDKESKIKFKDNVDDATSFKTVDTFLNASYSVNTTENFVDPSDKDAAIISITEMGLFDKNHKLIGYANFPPIEYRTDTQHVDFTAVISYSNLTELTDL